MNKELFYKSDELSSPFMKPKTPVKKIIKKKTKSNDIWNLENFIKNQFHKEFNNDQSNINAKDYKWIHPNNKLINISLQPWITNLPTAIESSLNLYADQFENTDIDIHKIKTNLNKDILRQITKQLSKSHIPALTNVENDLDPEYIFAKRQYLQSMIDLTQKDIDILQTELSKEKEQLTKATDFKSNLIKQNNQSLRQNLLNETLHPIMNKIIQNEFGLIKDTIQEDNKYNGPMRRNKGKYNLILSSSSTTQQNQNDEYEILNQSLPSLTKLNQFIPTMTDRIDNIISKDQLYNQLFK